MHPLLGANVYCWGKEEQNRLLASCLAPEIRELCASGLVRRFWFDRFDARGPHIFALLTLSQGAFPEVSTRLTARLSDHLAKHPSRGVIPPDQLATLHNSTRNKKLCAADGLPGIAENNTFLLFEQDSKAYPFTLSAGHPREDELWQLLHELALWAVERIAVRPEALPTAVVVRWAAGIDAALRAHGQAQAYWRYHATTLVLGLDENLARDEAEVLRSLPGAVGEKNRETFRRLWNEAAPSPAWPFTAPLVEVALTDMGRPEHRRFVLLREALHVGFKQLGMPVSLQIPLVLFAWSNCLSEEVDRS